MDALNVPDRYGMPTRPSDPFHRRVPAGKGHRCPNRSRKTGLFQPLFFLVPGPQFSISTADVIRTQGACSTTRKKSAPQGFTRHPAKKGATPTQDSKAAANPRIIRTSWAYKKKLERE
ncbi:hypothetical protein [Pseudomonas chlororaphis]|uniref:hypothetical protein n=1 Tax=Pseudomonas chlororaphis TaxID=587753 RepID=UPI0011D13E3A|nr:hypothetical protein [Pseudomonas chlororaphis]